MFRRFFTVAISLLVVSAGLAADNDTAAPVPRASDNADIARWIKQLDSGQFSDRTKASQDLEAAGKRAIPALGEAALGDSREASLRAIDILRKLFQESDAATKEAARQALKKVADSDRPSAARRAKEVLEPKPKAPQPAPNAMPIFGGQIQIQVHAGGNGKTKKVRVQNGKKEIEVSENNRKIKITEDPAQGIEIEVTETKDGKDTTKKYSAKTEAELKKNHPEAHKLYEEHSKQQPGIQIQGLQLNAGPAIPLPAIPVPAQAMPGMAQPARPQRQIAAAQLRAARSMVESATKLLERAKQGADDADALDKSSKNLEDIAKKLAEEEARLSGK